MVRRQPPDAGIVQARGAAAGLAPAVALVLLALIMPAAHAADAPAAGTAADAAPQSMLDRLERALGLERKREGSLATQAEAVAAELLALRRRMVDVAARAQALEGEMSATEEALDALFAEQDAKEESLLARRRQLGHLLVAVERIARRPPESLIVMPAPPVDTARSALLLKAALPAVRERAAALRDDLARLAELRREIALRRDRLEEATEALVVQREDLARMVARKATIEEETQAERRSAAARAAALAGQADNLRELLRRLPPPPADKPDRPAQQKPAPQKAAPQKPSPRGPVAEPGRPVETARLPKPSAGGPAAVRMPLPAAGRVTRGFGDDTEAGLPARGLTVITRPGAPVVAPRGGDVAFAGPFRGYGLLLIIRHAEGYHVLLAGMSRIDVAVGQEVLAGEPVGVMGAGNGDSPSLYVELRKNGLPINPLPWLTAGAGGVSG